ncbi:hypothetical protein FRC17_007856 [Serendipita sp. 399]|nr:hypothetical protein FRC17_007856 [Serendipita sp. 399]
MEHSQVGLSVNSDSDSTKATSFTPIDDSAKQDAGRAALETLYDALGGASLLRIHTEQYRQIAQNHDGLLQLEYYGPITHRITSIMDSVAKNSRNCAKEHATSADPIDDLLEDDNVKGSKDQRYIVDAYIGQIKELTLLQLSLIRQYSPLGRIPSEVWLRIF